MKRITEYEIINHGVMLSDYFQGCGVSFTEFTDVATGIGSSEREALDDALELLAYSDWDVDGNQGLINDLGRADTTDVIGEMVEDGDIEDPDGETPWVFVSVRVR